MPPDGGLRTSLRYRLQSAPLSGPLSSVPTSAFQSAWGVYSPGTPLVPIANEPVRAWDFPLAINTVIQPRASEPYDEWTENWSNLTFPTDDPSRAGSESGHSAGSPDENTLAIWM